MTKWAKAQNEDVYGYPIQLISHTRWDHMAYFVKINPLGDKIELTTSQPEH